MRLDSSLILAGFLSILAASAIAALHPQEVGSGQEIQMVLRTDKEIYRSGEMMRLSAELSGQIENATLSVRGVKDSRGGFRVQQDYQIPSGSPEKQINLTFVMPACYGCAGVSPGDYEIYAELIRGIRVANSTIAVRLEK